jgi:hypothetical protein
MCIDKSGLDCCFIAQEWLALYWSFFSGVGVNLHSPLANGKQGSIPEEMSLTLLANEKTRKPGLSKHQNQRKLSLNVRNTLFALYNHWST